MPFWCLFPKVSAGHLMLLLLSSPRNLVGDLLFCKRTTATTDSRLRHSGMTTLGARALRAGWLSRMTATTQDVDSENPAGRQFRMTPIFITAFFLVSADRQPRNNNKSTLIVIPGVDLGSSLFIKIFSFFISGFRVHARMRAPE